MLRRSKVTLQVTAMVLGTALLATGCSTNREITKPKPVPVTEARLAAALVTEADLPDEYAAAAQGTPIAAELISEHKCDDALKKLEPKQEATADFTSAGSRFTTTVAWFPGQGGAVDQLYHDVASDCAAVVVAAKELSLRTSNLNFGVLSDNTFAVKIDAEKTDGTIEERDLIVMREGDLVSIIRLVGPRPSDKTLLDTAVRAAIGRLGFLSDQTNP